MFHSADCPAQKLGLLHSVDCNCETCLAEVAAYNKKLARRKGKKRIVREDDVEGKFVEQQEAAGKLVLKVKVAGRPGYPDRWVLGTVDDVVKRIRHHFSSTQELSYFHEDQLRTIAADLVAAAFSMAELKKHFDSRFQPKQKTIIPMLRKRGFKVDIVHG